VRLALGVGTVALVLAACGFGGSSSGADTAAPLAQSDLRLVKVADGFGRLTHVSAPRSERGRLYVVEKAGRILILENGRLRARPFLDIVDTVGDEANEQGLLSVAFHPRYASNRKLYVNYTDRNGNTKVVEFRASASRVDPSTARQLLFVRQPYSNHNGGQLAFGPDGKLYVGMGDGGGQGDPRSSASCYGSTSIGPALAGRPWHTASVTPGASRSTASPATSGSPMWGSTSGRRSTT
jgi:glucose/arabinose dehydrogenase